MDRLGALSSEFQSAWSQQEQSVQECTQQSQEALEAQLKQNQESLSGQIADFETLTLSNAKQHANDYAEAMEKMRTLLESSSGQLSDQLTAKIEEVIQWQQEHKDIEYLKQALNQLEALNQRILTDSKDQKNFLVQVILSKINEQFAKAQAESQKLGAQSEKIHQDAMREHNRQIERTAGMLRNDVFKKLNEVIQRQHSNSAIKSLLESAASQKTTLSELKEYATALEQVSSGIRKRLDLAHQGITNNTKKADSIIKSNVEQEKTVADFGGIVEQIAEDFPVIVDSLKEILYSQFLEISNRFQMQDARFNTLHKVVSNSTATRRITGNRPNQRPSPSSSATRPAAAPTSSATRPAAAPSPTPNPPAAPRTSKSQGKANSAGTAPTKSFDRSRVNPRDAKGSPREAKAPSAETPPRPKPVKKKPGGRMESDLNFVDEI